MVINANVWGNCNVVCISRLFLISGEKKLENNDINFIEQEFNDFMLEDGFKSLFLFPKFKEFIKSVTTETN